MGYLHGLFVGGSAVSFGMVDFDTEPYGDSLRVYVQDYGSHGDGTLEHSVILPVGGKKPKPCRESLISGWIKNDVPDSGPCGKV